MDELTGPGELLLFPKFEGNRHKGQNGKVAVIGGGLYSGAPALSALGAYRSGVDLVHVFVPETSYKQVSTFAPELIVHKLLGDIITKENIKSFFEEEFDSIIIGPGMGKDKVSLKAVQLILEKCTNVVIDADAISNYDFHDKNIIITPHKGELTRLGLQDKREDLMSFANDNNVTILFKGEIDLITDGHFFKKNKTGHPRMAVGGSGDVLAGVCGAFMAKGLTPFESARLAAYSLGKAGEKCHEEIGAGFLPTDLALALSKILLDN
jgi:NAD(P)H-hydrate epimerase